MYEDADTDVATAPADHSAAAPVVTFDGRAETLIAPSHMFALAMARSEADVDAGGMAATYAYGAAALRMCWPESRAWPTRNRPREWRVGTRVVDYGAAIYETLRTETQGQTSLADLCEALIRAHNWAQSCLLSAEEVAAAVDFSGDQAAG